LEADLRGTDLTGVLGARLQLRGALIEGAIFDEAELNEADFEGRILNLEYRILNIES